MNSIYKLLGHIATGLAISVTAPYASLQAALSLFPAHVIGVTDGDTIRVLAVGNREIKIRLGEIDAPESKQPFGRASKQELSNILYGKSVTVIPSGLDRYGRTVAHVHAGAVDASTEMVRRGAAWVFIKYSHDPSLRVLEARARLAHLGLWALPAADRIPPWEWRSQKRAGAHAILPAFPTIRLPFTSHATPPNLGSACSAKRYCSQMSSCDEAIYHLKVCGQRRLDGDGDGKPCERLCG